MVRFVILLYVLIYIGELSAQDLIVKHTGERILCNIEDMTDFYIHFYEIKDTEKGLLYKMDLSLIERVSFAEDNSVPIAQERDVFLPLEIKGKYNSVETNIDGLINKYGSIHYQLLTPKVSFDLGFKRFEGRKGVFFGELDDKGSMVEMGISIPMKIFSDLEYVYRGVYIRGFGIYGQGSYRSPLQNFIIENYSQLTFGVQGVLAYQISNHIYLKGYYGLGGTIDVSNNSPRTKQADISSSDGVQNISGFKVGYIF